MTIHRFSAKRDASEPEIVQALRAAGFSVDRLSGKDIPDLLIGRGGVTLVAEVKTGTRKLQPGQAAWWLTFRGNPQIVLRSVDDALALARDWRSLMAVWRLVA